MKKRIYSMFAMLSLLFAVAVASVQAGGVTKLTVNIPFDFQIGDKTLPAGTYSVRQLAQNVVLIESADGKTRALAQTMGTVQAGEDEKAVQERLVFHQYGNQRFLAQVWMVRGSDGRALNRSNAERDAARGQKLARNDSQPQTVVIAAKAR
ncbi:MAG TPA: hypothetical protein VF791_21010 [Pyrinomonadaceae bacterium]